MGYKLGKASSAKLVGVHPKLVAVVQHAIGISKQDFAVTDGVRTEAEQRRLVARGASKTMNSKHRVQSDGFGHAVDLVPFENGSPRWEWPLIWAIAVAMDEAASKLQVPLVWGAVWDRNMLQYGGSADALKREVEEYKIRHPGPDFLDGPHYQLV